MIRRGNTSSLSSFQQRKRARNNKSGAVADGMCSFCHQVPAAITVEVPTLHRKKRTPTPYCLTCYYSTSAIRENPKKYVSVMDDGYQRDEQLPPMQQIFSEVFIQLQKEISEETAKVFQSQQKDPLAMLKRRPTNAGKRPPPPITQSKKAGNAGDGGFLRSVPVPQRILQTQQQQAKLQQQQIDRMFAAANGGGRTAAVSTTTNSIYQRRKASRKSIWNLAMDPKTAAAAAETNATEVISPDLHAPPCSCGSRDVQNFGNITSRNQDMKKGETWGMKDRGSEVITRYTCNSCGKSWNEEE